MTLDPSIILSGRPVQLQSPFEQAGQAMQLRELSMSMKAKAQAQADDEAIRKAFAANQNPDGSLNRQGVLAALATGNPLARQKLEHTWATEDAARTKAQNDAKEAALKVDAAQGKLFADVGGAVLQAHQAGNPEEAQRAWQTGLQRAKAAGLNVDGLPAQYDPQMAAGYYQIGINALERYKQDEYTGFHATEDGTAVQVNGKGQARPIRDFQGAPVKARAQAPQVEVSLTQPIEVTNDKGEKVIVQMDKKSGQLVPVAGGFRPKDPMNEAQGTAALLYDRAREAMKAIDAVGEDARPGMVSNLLQAAPGNAGNALIPAKTQQYLNAQRAFIAAVLRKESGAAISAEEFTNYAKMYFPQPGDGPDVIKQKADLRESAVTGLARQAGPALTTPLPAVVTEKPKPAAKADQPVMTMADAKATAKATGKTTAEVIAAAKKKGWRVE